MSKFLSKVDTDEAFRLREFPVAKRQIYLAHAGICPLPRRVGEAMRSYVDLATADDQETVAGDRIESTRESMAKFLGVSVEEVSILGSTSNALSVVAAGFPFVAGDNVIVYRDDYPANVYPWLALRERGVEVRTVKPSRIGVIGVDDVLAEVDSRTRLVALASCHFLSGYRLDLDEIGSSLRRRGVAFCVDGIQSLGAFPLSLEYVDFMAADSHKWLLGPSSAGVLYVRQSWQERLRVTQWGWHNLACPGFLAKDELEFTPGARRYEPGSANLVGIAGLEQAVALLAEIGIESVSRAIRRKRQFLLERLQSAGYRVLEPSIPEARWGGMLSFSHQSKDMPALFESLNQRNVRASLRQDRLGNRYLRFSPHFYNTEAELEQVIRDL